MLGVYMIFLRRKVIFASVVLALSIVLLITLCLQATSYAQSTGLGIMPRKNLTVKAGEQLEDTLYISNLNGKRPLTVTLRVVDFKATDETGTPALQLDENAPLTAWSLKPFITVPTTVSLEPREAKYIPISVEVPAGQGAGSYYSAIQYSAQSSGDETDFTVNAAGATLAFLTVPGKAVEQMSLQKFGTYTMDDGQTTGSFQSFFTTKPPLRFAYLLENRGDVAESPNGSIVVRNIFGQKVKTVENANPNSNLALRGQTRRFETCIESVTKEIRNTPNGQPLKVQTCKDPGLFPGIYIAELNLLYGINGGTTQEIKTTAIFWYMPWWFIGAILAIIGLIALAIWKLREKVLGKRVKHRHGQ